MRDPPALFHFPRVEEVDDARLAALTSGSTVIHMVVGCEFRCETARSHAANL
jgi:hypothetical protein